MIPAAIANLDFDAKLQLVYELWDSIAEDANKIPVSEEDKKEMQRRLDEYDKDGDDGEPWEVVRESIRARLYEQEA